MGDNLGGRHAVEAARKLATDTRARRRAKAVRRALDTEAKARAATVGNRAARRAAASQA